MSSYLWQNFLTDEWAKTQIIQMVTQMQSDYNLDQVIEIWPGQGALTQWLVMIFDRLTLIEMDQKMKPHLEKLSRERGSDETKLVKNSEAKQSIDLSTSLNEESSARKLAHSQTRTLNIIRWDILKQGQYLSSITDKSHTLIYGSLPYYITSPIFRLVMIECWHHHGLFIIQKEVWQKIASTATKKSYLRWLLNNYFDITITQIIPAHSFTPAPKVQSCVVKLTRLSQPKLSPEEYIQMLVLLDQINGYKRKTLGKIWKMIWRDDLPQELASKRLEELSWEEMKILV